MSAHDGKSAQRPPPDGALVAIIAHEFGHALDEIYPAKFRTAGAPELRADAWAGCALARLELTSNALGAAGLAESLTAISRYPSPAHPNWSLRLPALRLGYTGCGGDGSKFEKAARGSLK